MKHLVADLIELHMKCGAPVAAEPCIPDAERVQLRIDLIDEEVNRELLLALGQIQRLREIGFELEHPDQHAFFLQVADGIADAIAVLVGTGVEFGIPLARVWEAVHKANLAKAGGPKREDGKFLKPEGWKPPDIDGAVFGDR